MLFTNLKALIAANGLLMMTVAHADADRLRVTITPTRIKGEDDEEDDENKPRIDKPIVVTGTPEELDVDLPGHLARYTQVRTSMREVFEGLEKDLEEEKKAAEARIAEEKKRTAKGIPTITPPASAPKPAAPALPASKPAII